MGCAFGENKKRDLINGFSVDKKDYDKQFENLLHYFIFRHFIPTTSNEEKRAMIGASIISVLMIRTMFFMQDDLKIETLIEIARLYSSEIEYSDINFDCLSDAVKDDHNV